MFTVSKGTFCFGPPWDTVGGVYIHQHRWGNQRLALVAAQHHFLYAFLPHKTAQVIVECLMILVDFLRVESSKDSNVWKLKIIPTFSSCSLSLSFSF